MYDNPILEKAVQQVKDRPDHLVYTFVIDPAYREITKKFENISLHDMIKAYRDKQLVEIILSVKSILSRELK